MPRGVTDGTKRERELEKTMARFTEAERGTFGLRCVRYADFLNLPNAMKREALTEPTILMHEGAEDTVVMTIEQFCDLKTRVDGFKPKVFRRIEGKLWGEL